MDAALADNLDVREKGDLIEPLFETFKSEVLDDADGDCSPEWKAPKD